MCVSINMNISIDMHTSMHVLHVIHTCIDMYMSICAYPLICTYPLIWIFPLICTYFGSICTYPLKCKYFWLIWYVHIDMCVSIDEKYVRINGYVQIHTCIWMYRSVLHLCGGNTIRVLIGTFKMWIIHVSACSYPCYGVASLSRIDKFWGLFCKRAL